MSEQTPYKPGSHLAVMINEAGKSAEAAMVLAALATTPPAKLSKYGGDCVIPRDLVNEAREICEAIGFDWVIAKKRAAQLVTEMRAELAAAKGQASGAPTNENGEAPK